MLGRGVKGVMQVKSGVREELRVSCELRVLGRGVAVLGQLRELRVCLSARM